MNDLVHTKRVWLVNSDGFAAEQVAPPKKLTSGQRHYHYRLGLMAAAAFLERHGFRSIIEPSQSVLSYEKSDVWIDVSLKPPDNVAYVTSQPGYAYHKEVAACTADGQEMYRVNAKVVTAREILNCDYLAQITVSTHDHQGTREPIFIPLPKDLAKPAHYVLENVLGTLALMRKDIPKLKQAFDDQIAAEARCRTVAELIAGQDLPPLLE